MGLFIGLMSGTSLDGVDGVLAAWPESTPPMAERPGERGFVHREFDPALRNELMALNRSGADELHRGALAANRLSEVYAGVVATLLAQAGVTAREVVAIGAHGQTVRHRPQAFGGTGYTLQLINGALLAERCGIDVVCDFRSRDLAAGGQGAPLVPAFHAAVFAGTGRDIAVLNLGGIANLTLLPTSGMVRGFDTGPGNMLMDLWCERHLGRRFDAEGGWASRGQVLEPMLEACLADPFFALAPPKSTGRDLFDAVWLDARLPPSADATDVMATLAELTVRSVTDAIARHAPGTRCLLVCGGGAANTHLMSRLAARTGPSTSVQTTAALGVAPDRVEALAFAWLAKRFCERNAGNLPAVTGAVEPRVLGALYPAA